MPSKKKFHWIKGQKSAIKGSVITLCLVTGLDVFGVVDIKSRPPLFLPGVVTGAYVGVSISEAEKRMGKKRGAIASVKRIVAGMHEELDELSILDTANYEQKRDAILSRMGELYDFGLDGFLLEYAHSYRSTIIADVKKCGVFRQLTIDADNVEVCCAVTESARIKAAHASGVIYALPWAQVELSGKQVGGVKVERITLEQLRGMNAADWERRMKRLENERRCEAGEVESRRVQAKVRLGLERAEERGRQSVERARDAAEQASMLARETCARFMEEPGYEKLTEIESIDLQVRPDLNQEGVCRVSKCGIYREMNIHATDLNLYCAITKSANIRCTEGGGVIYALYGTAINLKVTHGEPIEVRRVSLKELKSINAKTDWEEKLNQLADRRDKEEEELIRKSEIKWAAEIRESGGDS